MVRKKTVLPLRVSEELQQRRTAPDYIVAVLREAIYEGSLEDGAILNQVAVAEHFGVSRVPVREAMRQLQAEGLLSAEAHRRPIVRRLTLERVMEIFDLRAMIEGYLVEKAMPNIDEKVIAQLAGFIELMHEPLDHNAWLSLNAEFHQVLYEPSDATTALELANQLRGRAERYLRMWSEGQGIHRNAEATREHERILEYVRNGDVASARREVEQHILHTRDEAVRMYRNQRPKAIVEPAG
ncbi:transcriptional regulator, GntR family [Streptosporangium subroseum]|uniref:Transcriptional regulator, GntR family n=1 Tax=Streptosporangium subroseum TaxID=106412 RepID=A0A239CYL5_9ACTN|nr:GntR family transcriptional regulator [Streptosporangium subroseum]SNS25315.1 transcriptional regulator, GntR family [Streptosporangium subroseum]